MSVILDKTTVKVEDPLYEKFLALLAMDRSDERFASLFAEVHQAIDAEMALAEDDRDPSAGQTAD